MKTKHLHHIVPKHMGGTNDKSNLILLTLDNTFAHKNYMRNMASGKTS